MDSCTVVHFCPGHGKTTICLRAPMFALCSLLARVNSKMANM